MNNVISYPSCIKIPATNSKQSLTSTMFPQKLDVKEVLSFNDKLISLASELFGEGKWSHTVTNQTLDFVEPFNGKYICGCITFLKIQFKDEMFHEDIGYCYAESATKGLSIYHARIGSVNEAFKKVLQCFGPTAERRIQQLTAKYQGIIEQNSQTEDLQLNNIDIQKPFTQTISNPIDKGIEQSGKAEAVFKSKSPNDESKTARTNEKYTKVSHNINHGVPGLSTVKVQDKIEQSGHPIRSTNSPKPQRKILNDIQLQETPQCNTETNHQKQEDNVWKENNPKKALTEEEILRMERKRKQLEKQAEYKRLMKEKGQKQMSNDKKITS